MNVNSRRGAVLVVEDQVLEREALLILLRKSGYNAWGVGDCAAALEALNLHDAIDVVLCDLRIGGSSQTGVDLLRRWKQRRPSTPFIFVTGVYEIAQVVEAVKLGAEDYITKPFNAAELVRRVQECIDAADDVLPSVDHARDDSEQFHPDFDLPDDLSLERLERIAIECALQRAGGNRTHAADALGISVRTLQRKLKIWRTPGGCIEDRVVRGIG